MSSICPGVAFDECIYLSAQETSMSAYVEIFPSMTEQSCVNMKWGFLENKNVFSVISPDKYR